MISSIGIDDVPPLIETQVEALEDEKILRITINFMENGQNVFTFV